MLVREVARKQVPRNSVVAWQQHAGLVAQSRYAEMMTGLMTGWVSGVAGWGVKSVAFRAVALVARFVSRPLCWTAKVRGARPSLSPHSCVGWGHGIFGVG